MNERQNDFFVYIILTAILVEIHNCNLSCTSRRQIIYTFPQFVSPVLSIDENCIYIILTAFLLVILNL